MEENAQPVNETRQPDIEAQREAMKKLGFLVGKWSGEARVLRGPGQMVELIQTEEAQYKLDGLILLVQGVGRAKADGQLALQALGIASYDDTAGKYRMRAYNNGHWLDTDIALIEGEGEQGIRWGFSFGDLKTSSTLRINELGEWTELAELTIGDQPPRKFMELAVRRES